MHKTLPRLMSILMALAIGSASGAHWVLLQSVAWAGMVATYAQDRPLAQAVSDTFDGQHPCDMCKAIADGKKSERKLPLGSAAGKIGKVILFFVPDRVELVSTFLRAGHWADALYSETRREAPALPPPRLA